MNRKVEILLVFFFLVSCSNNLNRPAMPCINQPFGISYPYDKFRLDPQERTLIPVDNHWIPEFSEKLNIINNPVIEDDNDHIWLAGPDLYRYQVSTKKMKQYFLEASGEKDSPQTVIMTKDGLLWGVGFSRVGTKPILSRFNPIKEVFEPIMDRDHILIIKEYYVDGGMIEDSAGNIWISIDDKIYTYNPKTNVGKEIYDARKESYRLGNSLQIDKNNEVWGLVISSDRYGYLININPENYEIKFLPIPTEEKAPLTSILIDNESQIWVSDYAYWKIGQDFPIESYEGWNIVFRSPVFITRYAPYNEYKWVRPDPLFEDRDGNLWFSSYGLIKLDKKNGEWCKVVDSTFSSVGFTQSNNGEYWMVKDGQLYRYK
jgi:hypothetical protein